MAPRVAWGASLRSWKRADLLFGLLLAISIAALSVVLLKLWQFFRLRPEHNEELPHALSAWRQGEHEQAWQMLKAERFSSEIVVLAMRELAEGGADQATLREELERVALGEAERVARPAAGA